MKCDSPPNADSSRLGFFSIGRVGRFDQKQKHTSSNMRRSGDGEADGCAPLLHLGSKVHPTPQPSLGSGVTGGQGLSCHDEDV